ncbi:hypothetical protein [Shouchella clausii]|uniref:hypothetical protein n=1 Tax=Shouchella clausii TaxID=79880 RepID=UPI000B9632C9|nr:hypothetical protein [Shouchella clausii]AST96462.1 hypothetical protein BC8716_11095 [Shouchella clausii]MCR1289570.1 hypothetical protein [Shouchella clausii]MEB5475285.1 hypothetical protein [Shouchella clausii]MEB5481045.1 hypothetical protein [Shouchella clausii]QNM42819.1 hypothetical protein DUT88_07950 [Shouchella clausii]
MNAIEGIVEFAAPLFIAMELASLVCLLLFGVARYGLDKRGTSMIFIFLFVGITALEAGLGWLLYKETGELSTLQIIITVFVLYAVTFGVQDFKKLDRWMKQKIGRLRGIDLLTDKDREQIAKQKDPSYQARMYRRSSFAHLLVFLIAQTVFFALGTNNWDDALSYVRDLSWLSSESYNPTNSPYPNETIHSISMLWGVIFLIDTIYSWSYTFWPKRS